jgi:predicted transcriptional regulator
MPDVTPLDDVEFLARSPHRVTVLRTLATGPRTRPDLHDETGISQPTLGRVLGALQDRTWVERRGREYALTPFGGLVAEAFAELLDTVGTVQRLGEVVSLLPADELDFDVREFRDATVTAPTLGDAFRHVRRIEELYYGADRGRVMIDTVPPGSPVEHRERAANFLAGDQRYEAINSAETLDRAVEDPEVAEILCRAVESGRIDLYRYEGSFPFLLWVAGDLAMLAPKDEHGMLAALVETDNEAILAWVNATIDEYRDRSTRLTADDLRP